MLPIVKNECTTKHSLYPSTHTGSRNCLQPGQTGLKKHPIRLAEIIFTQPPALLLPVPAAAAPANPEIRTIAALFCRFCGSLQKSAVHQPLSDYVKVILVQISHPIRIHAIEITGIDTAVRLHNILDTAYAPLLTGFRHASHQNPHIILELPDIGLLPFLQIQIPQLKQIDQKPAIRPGRQRILLTTPILSDRIQTGNILLPAKSQLPVILINPSKENSPIDISRNP